MWANAAAATEQRSSVAANLEDLITRDSQSGTRRAKYQSEDKERVAARNLLNATIGEIGSRLTGERERGEDARGRLG